MSISQGRATTPAPVSSRYRTPSVENFRPQPEGGEHFSPWTLAYQLAVQRDGVIFAHGIAIGRLVGNKHTAASAISPCTKIATVAHAGTGQRPPQLARSRATMPSNLPS